MLLDEGLHVRLADFGLAKGAADGGAAGGGAARQTHLSTINGVKGTPGFMDPLMTNSGGCVSEVTDGFAMGVTVLIALTGLEAVNIVPRCRHLLRSPAHPDKWMAPGVPDARAGEWPMEVTSGLVEIIKGLALELFKEERMPLPEALSQLEVGGFCSCMPWTSACAAPCM